MSNQIVRIIVPIALLLHGVSHGGALVALIWVKFRPGDNTGGWLEAHSWLFPSLQAPAPFIVASIFWILSLLGFAAAALSFWGVLIPVDAWRQIAVVFALVSILGIVLFFNTWPPFNTFAALAMNFAVLITQLWLRWPAGTVR